MPVPKISEQQASNFKALMDAYFSDSFRVDEKLLTAEVKRIFKSNASASKTAVTWANTVLSRIDQGKKRPKFPFEQKGNSAAGILSSKVLKTRQRPKNHLTGTKLMNWDESDDAEESRHSDSEDAEGEVDEDHLQKQVASGKKSSAQEDVSTMNTSLRFLPNGEQEGLSPKFPAPEGTVIMHAESDQVEYVDGHHWLPRTITNFKFVSSKDDNEMVSVGRGLPPIGPGGETLVHLIGLVASANRHWEMGQRAQSGLWWYDMDIYYERPVELIFMRIPVRSISAGKALWWRDGKSPIVCVWSDRGVYALQGADIPYAQRYAGCQLWNGKVPLSRPIDFSTLKKRKPWMTAKFFPDFKKDYRRMLESYPQNARAPVLPSVTAKECIRYSLEGQLALAEWRVREKLNRSTFLKKQVEDLGRDPRVGEDDQKQMEEAMAEAEQLLAEAKKFQEEVTKLKGELSALETTTSQDAGIVEAKQSGPEGQADVDMVDEMSTGQALVPITEVPNGEFADVPSNIPKDLDPSGKKADEVGPQQEGASSSANPGLEPTSDSALKPAATIQIDPALTAEQSPEVTNALYKPTPPLTGEFGLQAFQMN